MENVLAGMMMSLDGFIEDRHGNVARLYPNLDAMRQTVRLQEEIGRTGAVVMGRRAYDMAQGDFSGYEFQVWAHPDRRGMLCPLHDLDASDGDGSRPIADRCPPADDGPGLGAGDLATRMGA